MCLSEMTVVMKNDDQFFLEQRNRHDILEVVKIIDQRGIYLKVFDQGLQLSRMFRFNV